MRTPQPLLALALLVMTTSSWAQMEIPRTSIDLFLFSQEWMQESESGELSMDLNGDGRVDHLDLLILIQQFPDRSTISPNRTPTPRTGPQPGETITVQLDLPAEATPLEMVLIPAGEFTMGSPSNEQGRNSDEGSQRQVTISRDFYMGKYPVTQAHYQAVMGSNPSNYTSGISANRPVEQVTWLDAARFCNRLSELMGYQIVYDESDWSANMSANGFRLPTEAEWEYAARAGTTTRFYWGDDPNEAEIDDYAWYSDNSGRQTQDVGWKLPNTFGLYDMSGNVWEWCQDWYASYPDYDVFYPLGPQTGLGRVIRGGSWGYNAEYLRSAQRDGRVPSAVIFHLGFRVVLPNPTSTPHPGPQPGDTITVQLDLPAEATALEMVLIPAGEFTMGSSPNEQGQRDEEGPQRRVTISRSFYMGKYPVTQAHYQAVMGSNPSIFTSGISANRPVEQVTWLDAARFCNRLSELMGYQIVYNESDWSANMSANGFRLPTEAEWEYAARAGTTTRFYWGDDPSSSEIDDYAWHRGNSGLQTQDVGWKLPNRIGLYDMSGNVWEWCQDWYASYPDYDEVDPLGPQSGSERVERGGSWNNGPVNLRSAQRNGLSPSHGGNNEGFRVAISIIP